MTLNFTALLLIAALQQSAQPPLLKPVEAQMVIVDAFVTDSKGRPIPNLKREDFELFEDNRSVAIDAFEAPTASVIADPTAPSRGATTQATAAPRSEPIVLAIYIDRWLLSPSGRKRALDQAITIAQNHLGAGGRVVVLAEDHGLHSLTTLTNDAAAIRTALMSIEAWATQSPGDTEARQVLSNVEDLIEMAKNTPYCDSGPGVDKPAPCVCVFPQLVQMVRGYATFRAVEAQAAGERLTAVVTALGSLPGRKGLVYISEGLEQRPGIQLYDQLGSICPEQVSKDPMAVFAPMQEFETSGSFRETAARANIARVTLYPLDARGLAPLSSTDVSIANPDYVPNAKNDGIKDANLVNQYRLLADETGGFAIIRGLEPGAVTKRLAAEDAGHYIIGFTPGEPDARTHRLRLEFNAKTKAPRSAQIRHRQSYYRAALPARRGQRALATLLLGLEENTLDAQAVIERTSATEARVRLSIPAAKLKTLEGAAEARLQIVVSFRDTASSKNSPVVREKEVTYSADDLLRAPGRREVVVDVPIGLGAYEFAVGVEDQGSGAAAYLRRSIAPNEPPVRD